MSMLLSAAVTTGSVHVEYGSIVPELVLSGGAMLLLVIASVIRQRIQVATAALFTILLSLGAMVSAYFEWHHLAELQSKATSVTGKVSYTTFAGSIAYDKFSLFFAVILLSALVLSVLVSTDWLEERGHRGVEYFVLMMLSTVGALLMAAANDLIVIFLGLEILSIALYVLCGYDRNRSESRESAIKYFVLGGFSSAIFLYGIALTYGATGSTNLTAISEFLSINTLLDNGLLLAGMSLLAVGFAFKVAAVPFHQWTPDVYQGAPSPVVGFMAAAAKAGAFAAFLRVFATTFSTLGLDWKPLILALAIVTLLVGSIVACVQQNVKRMLAYSSISHAGFILLGLQAGGLDGIASSLYYLFAYTFMVIGSFAIVTLVGGQSESRSGIEAYRGLGFTNPGIAILFAVLLLAQAGVPLTSGFLAKFYIISALVQGHSYATAIFAMITAAIAAFFYLRLVVVMFTTVDANENTMVGSDGDVLSMVVQAPVVLPFATALALGFSLVFTIGLGIAPTGHYMIDAVAFARSAASELFTSPIASSSGG